jgi:Ca2+-binding EF-hand superfamily protein
MTFSAFDLDGDGIVIEQEFDTARAQRMAERAAQGAPMRGAANAPAFSDFDLNGDGRLTPEEFATVQQSRIRGRPGGGMGPGAGMGPGGGMGMGPGAGMGRNMPAFAEFDLNSDGVLTEQEFYEARANRIAERSQQGYPMRNLANAPSFETIDLSGDGRITPDEFSAGQAQHHRQGMWAP